MIFRKLAEFYVMAGLKWYFPEDSPTTTFRKARPMKKKAAKKKVLSPGAQAIQDKYPFLKTTAEVQQMPKGKRPTKEQKTQALKHRLEAKYGDLWEVDLFPWEPKIRLKSKDGLVSLLFDMKGNFKSFQVNDNPTK